MVPETDNINFPNTGGLFKYWLIPPILGIPFVLMVAISLHNVFIRQHLVYKNVVPAMSHNNHSQFVAQVLHLMYLNKRPSRVYSIQRGHHIWLITGKKQTDVYIWWDSGKVKNGTNILNKKSARWFSAMISYFAHQVSNCCTSQH